MTEILEVRTTVDSEAGAHELARHVIETRLAACVQVLGPIASVYRWRGDIQEAEEWLLLIKTTRAAYPAIEAAIAGAHPYDVPEVLALPAADSLASYAKWITEEVKNE
jgi:periplasmic divalent cation tolerance protein